MRVNMYFHDAAESLLYRKITVQDENTGTLFFGLDHTPAPILPDISQMAIDNTELVSQVTPAQSLERMSKGKLLSLTEELVATPHTGCNYLKGITGLKAMINLKPLRIYYASNDDQEAK